MLLEHAALHMAHVQHGPSRLFSFCMSQTTVLVEAKAALELSNQGRKLERYVYVRGIRYPISSTDLDFVEKSICNCTVQGKKRVKAVQVPGNIGEGL